MFVPNRALIAQRLDEATVTLRGEPTTLASNVGIGDGASLSVSPTVVTYGGGLPAETLTWYSRSGERLETIAASTTLHNPSLSPDGKQLLI